jgi:hypothetical protein
MFRNLLAGLAVLCCVSCGGGDDEEEANDNPNGNVGRGTLTIERPTTDAAYTTPSPLQTAVVVSGTAFTQIISCTVSFPTSTADIGVTVTWTNAAGGSGTASQSAHCCGFLSFSGRLCDSTGAPNRHDWNTTIPISPGTNLITVIATDSSGNLGRDTITITR